MRRVWLFLAQLITVAFAGLFIVAYFMPELIDQFRPFSSAKPAPAPKPTPAQTAITPRFSFREAVEKANPAVVSIFTVKKVSPGNSLFSRGPFFDQPMGSPVFPRNQQEIKNLGSGVIIDPSGLILTNNHVVEAADQIEVALADGKTTYKPKIIGTDPETDLALLKIEATGLPSIPLGNSEQLKVGDIVLAIGNPFGVGRTVTMGIISALGRTELGINTYEKFIQTDAAINPGNSGGPLIDLQGNVVGINTAIFSETGGSLGIGFAIPAEMVKKIVAQIKEHGQVIRGWLGVEVAAITPEIIRDYGLPKETSGALLWHILQNSPLVDSGIKAGDIIVAVNDQPVVKPRELIDLVADLVPGSDAKITVLRENKTAEYKIKVGQRPLPPAAPKPQQ